MHASVADVIEFESWPPEQQDLAKRVLYGGHVYAYQDDDDKSLPPEPKPRKQK